MESSVRSGLESIPPRVYFHIRDEYKKREVGQFTEVLLENGFDVPKVIIVDYGPSRSEIRFFRKEEVDEAKRVQSILDKKGLSVGLKDLSQKYWESKAIRPRHYELWLGLEAFK